ncbi:MAG: TAXI family TRAP transporter solute-binding subunit, partial [Nitrososphaerota archaeon]|nr:TAXI family TRAP transporter solute-binding subunit [Nitrososphaerota archaeon]
KLIHTKAADLIFTHPSAIIDAYNGVGYFKDVTIRNVKVLTFVGTSVFTIATREDSGIKTIRDLKGKRINMGGPEFITYYIIRELLTMAGIDPDKDTSPIYVTTKVACDLTKEGKLDAFGWTGTIPSAVVYELSTAVKIRFVTYDEFIPRMIEKYKGAFYEDVQPKSSYHGVDYDVKVLGVPVVLACRADLPADLVYHILRVMVDFRDELITIHKAWSEFTLKDALKGVPLDFLHEGAKRFFIERGLKI